MVLRDHVWSTPGPQSRRDERLAHLRNCLRHLGFPRPRPVTPAYHISNYPEDRQHDKEEESEAASLGSNEGRGYLATAWRQAVNDKRSWRLREDHMPGAQDQEDPADDPHGQRTLAL